MVFVIIIGSTLAFHVWIAIYSAFPSFNFQHEVIYLYSTANFWFSMIVSQVIAIGPKYLYKYIQTAYYPLDADIVREMNVLGSKGKAEHSFDAEQAGISPFATKRTPTREQLPLVAGGDLGARTPRQRGFSHETASEEPISPWSDRHTFSSAPHTPSLSSPAQGPYSPPIPPPSPYGAASSSAFPASSPTLHPAAAIPIPAIHVSDSTPRGSYNSSYATPPTSLHPTPQQGGARDSVASEFDPLDYANHRDSQWGPQPSPGAVAFDEAALHSRSPLVEAHRQWVSSSSAASGQDAFYSAQTSPAGTPTAQGMSYGGGGGQSPQQQFLQQQQQGRGQGHQHTPSYASGNGGYAM